MMSPQSIEQSRAKAQDFLWIVQAGLLTLAAKVRRSDPDRDGKLVAEYSGTGVFIHIDEAVRAAGRIPDAMTAGEAAESFCSQYTQKDRTSRPEVPGWFARYADEPHDYTLVSKADQFLWTVQTAALADAENQASVDARAKNPERFCEATIIETIAQAVRVAQLIPSGVEATEAASDFLAYYAPGMRELSAPPRWCRP